MRKQRPIGCFYNRWLGALLAVASATTLAGCNSSLSFLPDPSAPDVYDAVAQTDLRAKPGVVIGRNADIGNQAAPRGITYEGRAQPGVGGRGGRGEGAAGGGDYNVDFDNTPIAAVAKSIIVDTLNLSLNVDPRVAGNISLSSGRALNRNELLLALESALRSANANMVKDGAGYRIVPASETAGLGGIDRSRDPAPGYGISVLPLRYISADNMMKLIDSFAAKPGAIRVDTTRNLMIVQGTGDERRTTMDTAAAFDQDWMRGQSVGVYPLGNASPETIITELQRILDAGEGGAYKGILQFQPIARMNAVLAVARRPEALRAVTTWIKRLDRADNASNLSRVYRVKYGSATALARILNQSFGGGGGGGGGGDAPDAIEPGAGRLTVASSGTTGGNQLGGRAGTGAGGTGGSEPFGGGGQNASPFGALPGRGGAQTGAAGGNASGAGGTTDFGAGNRAGGPGAGGAGGGGASRGEGKVSVTAESSTNSLLIFADRERFRMIERVLQQLDRPRLQVAIEATIAEVSLNEGLEFGVQYFLRSGDKGSASLQQTAGAVISKVLPGFNLLLGAQADPRAILNALTTKTNVKVLSSPSVVVLDNQVASIQVGDQVPVSTTQATLVGATSTGILSNPAFPVANNIDYRNTGVILRVLPRVSANGNVTLEIDQEISNVVNNSQSGTLTPTISQRHIKSTISVTSNQTVLLGGLISDRQTGGREGIPFLSTIAYLGDLFSHNQTARNRTELIVFIKPQIITDSVDAQSVAEQMRAKMFLSGRRPVQSR